MGNGFFIQIVQAVNDLLNTHEAMFINIGLTFWGTLAVILLAWTGLSYIYERPHHADGSKFVSLVIWLAITQGMLVYYDIPMPGSSRSFHRLLTDPGIDLARIIDNGITEQLGNAMGEATPGFTLNFSVTGFFTMNLPAMFYPILVTILLSLTQAAILFVISWGFVVMGVGTLFGPIFIPFSLVPKMDWIFWNWLKGMIQVSFYPAVANAIVFVYAKIWLNFFRQNPGPYTLENLATMIIMFLVLCLVSVMGIMRTTNVVSTFFSGQSGDHAMPGLGWWR